MFVYSKNSYIITLNKKKPYRAELGRGVLYDGMLHPLSAAHVLLNIICYHTSKYDKGSSG